MQGKKKKKTYQRRLNVERFLPYDTENPQRLTKINVRRKVMES